MTQYHLGKLYKLETDKRLYDRSFDSKTMLFDNSNDPEVIEQLKKNDIVVIVAIIQSHTWDEFKVISKNGTLGWIDNINEDYFGFLKEVTPLRKKNK